MFTSVLVRTPRMIAALAAGAVGLTVVAALTAGGSAIPNVITVHTLTFYGLTAGAYAALPFVRRGDVLMVAIWLVLAAGVAPCLAGQEISAPHMFADMAGVVLAAIPIYVARLRQLLQGDMRPVPRRRQTEREAPSAEKVVELAG